MASLLFKIKYLRILVEPELKPVAGENFYELGLTITPDDSFDVKDEQSQAAVLNFLGLRYKTISKDFYLCTYRQKHLLVTFEQWPHIRPEISFDKEVYA